MRRLSVAACLSIALVSGRDGSPAGQVPTPCAISSSGLPCSSATGFALESMRARGLVATMVMEDVATGTQLVRAASHPGVLDTSTPIRPLSFMKVFLAASWWERGGGNRRFECVRQSGREHARISVHAMLVTGCDLPGKQMAIELARQSGRAAMLADLDRFAGVRPTIPIDAADAEWADMWSIGENDVTITLPTVSHFLRAVGNGGEPILQARTTALLMVAMRDAVRRGTAQGSDDDLRGTSWTMGGKTGSGQLDAGQPLDGLFAGLVFDPTGRARFTVVTYVKHGGNGGGEAARLSARVARHLAGD